MPAFTDARMHDLEVVLYRLHYRATAHKATDLTHDDMLHLLVRPEHHDKVHAARELFGNESGEGTNVSTIDPGSGDRLTLYIYLYPTPEHPGFPFPKYVGDAIYGDPEGEARRKLDAWVKWRCKVGRDWALARTVLHTLNRECANPQALRYVWPSILGLLSMSDNDGLKKLADKLRPYKAPAKMPTITPALAEATRRATAIISRGMLYPEAPDTVPAGTQVGLVIHEMPMPPRPWDESQRLWACGTR